eukprot:m.480756 g.480756  ORF g.480756 m.480756 type:complete len:55 (+) comp21937_c0_seq1:2003-2167(+)
MRDWGLGLGLASDVCVFVSFVVALTGAVDTTHTSTFTPPPSLIFTLLIFKINIH